VIDVTLRFDDVLDVKLVEGALQRLLNLPGWHKLGARMKVRVSFG
jgi:hypothetical protein